MTKSTKLILFDLDGVLIDSEKNMKTAWQEVRKKFNIKVKFKNYRKYVGLPFYKVLKHLKIKDNFSEIKKTFDKSSIKNVNLIKLHPGAKSTILKLKKKCKLGLVTSKDNYRTKIILRKLNLNFKYIVALKPGMRGKPYPDQLKKAIRLFKFTKLNNVFYVGDTLIDQKFAKNAKVKYIHADYGFEKKRDKCNTKIKKLIEILEII